VITGFNTDVEHEGVVYHVQTEDKGLETPLILSLVYSGGAILASKRSPYQDLIASGFSEAMLAERLMRQHRLICAAIHAGRIEELKRMTSKAPEFEAPRAAGWPPESEPPASELPATTTTPEPEFEIEFTPQEPTYQPVISEPVVTTEQESEFVIELTPGEPTYQPVIPAPVASTEPQVTAESEVETKPAAPKVSKPAEPYTVYDSRRQSPLGEIPRADEGLGVSLLDEQDFNSGDQLTVRVFVSYRSAKGEKPISDAAISLKVLGTTFRPQIYTTKTESDGVAIISTQIPTFTSGRAAILIRAVYQGDETEIRRVIHPSR
jgi:hypothetical protein